MKALLYFMVGFLFVEFTYWLTGVDVFIRSPDTAFVFSIACAVGFSTALVMHD